MRHGVPKFPGLFIGASKHCMEIRHARMACNQRFQEVDCFPIFSFIEQGFRLGQGGLEGRGGGVRPLVGCGSGFFVFAHWK